MSASLQQLKSLFDTIQNDIATLEKRKEQLNLEIKSAESRQAFQQAEIKKLKATAESITATVDERNQTIAEAETQLDSVRAQRDEANVQLKETVAKNNMAANKAAQQLEMNQSHNNQLSAQKADLEQSVAIKQAEINKLEDMKRVSRDLLRDIQKQVDTAKSQADHLIDNYEQQTEESRQHLSAVKEEVEAATQNRHAILEEITQAKKQLAELEKSHAVVLQAEATGKRKLRAFETSLLAREQKFEEALARAKRPGGILSGVDL